MKLRVALALIVLMSWAAMARQANRSVWEGVFSDEQADRGRKSFAQYCAACHGSDAEGGEEAPPLQGGAFSSNWTGLTVGDLSERVRLTMPPANPGRLSRQQNADIVAFMLKLNSYPAGKEELDVRPEVMKMIRIEAKP